MCAVPGPESPHRELGRNRAEGARDGPRGDLNGKVRQLLQVARGCSLHLTCCFFASHLFGLSALGECQCDNALNYLPLIGMEGSAHTFLRNAGSEWWESCIDGCKTVDLKLSQ